MIGDGTYVLRQATIDDTLAYALTVDNWIEKTVGDPCLFEKQQPTERIKNAIPLSEAWVIG